MLLQRIEEGYTDLLFQFSPAIPVFICHFTSRGPPARRESRAVKTVNAQEKVYQAMMDFQTRSNGFERVK